MDKSMRIFPTVLILGYSHTTSEGTHMFTTLAMNKADIASGRGWIFRWCNMCNQMGKTNQKIAIGTHERAVLRKHSVNCGYDALTIFWSYRERKLRIEIIDWLCNTPRMDSYIMEPFSSLEKNWNWWSSMIFFILDIHSCIRIQIRVIGLYFCFCFFPLSIFSNESQTDKHQEKKEQEEDRTSKKKIRFFSQSWQKKEGLSFGFIQIEQEYSNRVM